MLSKEQKKEAQQLISKLETLRPKLAKIEVYPEKYEILSATKSIIYGGLALFCSLITVYFVMKHQTMRVHSLTDCGAILFSAVLFGINAFLSGLFWLYFKVKQVQCKNNIANLKRLNALRNTVREYTERITKENERVMVGLRLEIKKFEALRPVVIEELHGEFALCKELCSVEFYVYLPQFRDVSIASRRYVVNHDGHDYGELILNIREACELQRKIDAEKAEADAKAAAAATERQRIIAKFEAELAEKYPSVREVIRNSASIND